MKTSALLLALSLMAQAPAADLGHTATEFRLEVSLPYAQVAPLFGALAEQKWAPDWRPQFVYPLPAADQEGSVFKVEHCSQSSIWITTVFNLPGGHIQYVYLLNNLLITRIDILLTKEDSYRTGVSVTYERTVLDAAATDHLRHLAKRDAEAGPEWQAALHSYAAKVKSHGALSG